MGSFGPRQPLLFAVALEISQTSYEKRMTKLDSIILMKVFIPK